MTHLVLYSADAIADTETSSWFQRSTAATDTVPSALVGKSVTDGPGRIGEAGCLLLAVAHREDDGYHVMLALMRDRAHACAAARHRHDTDALFHAADRVLYDLKNAGKDAVQIASP